MHEYDIKLSSPANKEEITKAEQLLNTKIPQELFSLLLISNGANQVMKHPRTNEIIEIGSIYWTINDIIDKSLEQYEYLQTISSGDRTKYLFFSDNGCGEYFGYRIQDGECNDRTIYIYYPIDNEYVKVAENLEDWMTKWLSGDLST